MIDTRWRIEDEPGDPELVGAPRPLVTTWGTVWRALRRTWWAWGAAAVAGLLLAGALLVVRPPGGEASTTLLLAHPEVSDESAMATDVSLLETRAVAAQVIADLALETTPEGFLSTVDAVPVTNQILELTVTGPTEAQAQARTEALVTEYLAFRSEQLRLLSDSLVSGYQDRVAELTADLEDVTRRYNSISGSTATDQTRAQDLLAQRTTLASQIGSLQREIEDTSFATDAAISSTHVVDEPHVIPHSRLRTVLLYLVSGLLAGLFIGMGVVVFRTLTSETVRTRGDVARALGVPVRASVRRGGPSDRLLPRLASRAFARARRLVGMPDRRGERDLDVLASTLDAAVPSRRRRGQAQRRGRQGATPRSRQAPVGVALAALDCVHTGAAVVARLAGRYADDDEQVLLVDLSEAGVLGRHTHPLVTTFRPSGVPSLARGPAGGRTGLVDPQERDLLRDAWEDAEVVLVLAEVDPGVDLGNLSSWVSRVVPLVRGGRSRSQLLGTVSELVAVAELEMPFALMTRADADDDSAGLPEPAAEAAGAAEVAARRR